MHYVTLGTQKFTYLCRRIVIGYVTCGSGMIRAACSHIRIWHSCLKVSIKFLLIAFHLWSLSQRLLNRAIQAATTRMGRMNQWYWLTSTHSSQCDSAKTIELLETGNNCGNKLLINNSYVVILRNKHFNLFLLNSKTTSCCPVSKKK